MRLAMTRKFLIFIVSLFTIFGNAKSQCFRVEVQGFRTSETPNYLFSMKLYKNSTLSSITRVLEEIRTPMWSFLLGQHMPRVKEIKVLYNTTMKVCDFWTYIKRLRMFNNLAQTLLQGGKSNMSLECPLKKATYVLQDIVMPAETPLLRYIYMPNALFTLYGKVYAQLRNKKLELKCTYEINATIIKTC